MEEKLLGRGGGGGGLRPPLVTEGFISEVDVYSIQQQSMEPFSGVCCRETLVICQLQYLYNSFLP